MNGKAVASVLAGLVGIYILYVANHLRLLFMLADYGGVSAGDLLSGEGFDFAVLILLNGLLLLGLIMRRWWSTLRVLAVIDVGFFLRDATVAPLLGIVVLIGLLVPGVSASFSHDED